MSAGSSEAVATWSQRCLCSLVDHIFRGYYASDLEVLKTNINEKCQFIGIVYIFFGSHLHQTIKSTPTPS